MKIVTSAQMRELDRRTVEEGGIKSEMLMDRAGEVVAHSVRRLAELAGLTNPFVLLIAGRGNNGGDAFVAARFLKSYGFDIEVWLAASDDQVRGDALLMLSRMKAADIPLREMATMDDWQDALKDPFAPEIIVDGILGTGITGPARGPAAGAIQYIRARSDDALILSIDVPSGLNADTGSVEGDAVQADVTVTMGLPKKGLVHSSAVDYVGSLDVADIGIPPEYVTDVLEEDAPEYIYLTDLKPLFKRRKRVSHKGDYGHVVLIGGSQSMSGSITLAARAALRSGAGLVSVITPIGIAQLVAAAVPEALVYGTDETKEGAISFSMWSAWKNKLDLFDAILIGPGLTRGPDALNIVRSIVREASVPVVVDADAISVLAGQPDYFEKARKSTVLTPHPGEMATLAGIEVAEVEADRCGVASGVAARTNGVVILKGAGTVVAQSGRQPHINLTGNPGMATAGSGDVLAGILTGLIGQGFALFDAARAAVYLHGRAGDIVALRKSQASLIAGDLIDELPFAYREVSMR